jgi:hypothetical protein
MSKVIIEVYEAFKSAGIPEDKATAAAKAIAEIGQEERLTLIEKEITEIKGDTELIKWMLGVIIAGILSLILKAFF